MTQIHNNIFIGFWVIICSTILTVPAEDDVKVYLFNPIEVSPYPVKVGDNVTLSCSYLHLGETTYSITWFKDGMKLFKISKNGSETLNKSVSRIVNVNVNFNTSDETHLQLTSVNGLTSGKYECEIDVYTPTSMNVVYSNDLNVIAASDSKPIKMKGIRVPPTPIILRSNITLHCDYELGDETLDFIKWFKGANEIYRLVKEGSEIKSKYVAPNAAKNINLNGSDDKKLLLTSINEMSGGEYSCVISTTPSFIKYSAKLNLETTAKSSATTNHFISLSLYIFVLCILIYIQ